MTITKIIHGTDTHDGGTNQPMITVWADDDCDTITDHATYERAEELAEGYGLTRRIESGDGTTTWVAS